MTNLEYIQKMSVAEFTVLIEDMQHYDDPDYGWQSKIQPPLPFTDWSDWLYMEVEYGE